MKLALMFSARCNASCGHCSTSCGPHRTESLSRDRIFSLMDEAAALSHSEPLKIGLTGGEPFLDFELLCEIVAHGKRLGAEMGCVTNAYWATSEEKARTLLSTLQSTGLLVLSVSSSRFHEEFVNVGRVERALNAARDIGLQCELKVVSLRSDVDDEAHIRAWAEAAGADRVQVFSVLPHLRSGEVLPESEYTRSPGLPAGPCPGTLTTVGWDGEAHLCATPGAFTPYFSLGNVHQVDLGRIQQRQYLGGKPQILREHGPIYFAREIRARGLGPRLRESYTSVCELCTHIAADPVLAQVAEEAADALEVTQLHRILDRKVEPLARTSLVRVF
ncbi:MAG: radical SAM protein [Panacagrimonas sp.]